MIYNSIYHKSSVQLFMHFFLNLILKLYFFASIFFILYYVFYLLLPFFFSDLRGMNGAM